MAGFGGGGKSSKAGSKKGKKNGSNKQAPLTLKPKQQWDRYANLKAATAVRVGVRVVNDGEETNEWFETGKVKSENDESIEVAVLMQRGIIAEVSIYNLIYNSFFFTQGFYNLKLCEYSSLSNSIQKDCIHSRYYLKIELNGDFLGLQHQNKVIGFLLTKMRSVRLQQVLKR